ncbi:protein snakeskin [Ceratitis capitata]|uniref:(Mediterranean fruit fly) hypothetical protein n=1 Tax=Ceratitis capitata TaxID=7213 RepID=W8CEK0_CERCA|nr:protein snakeskin [Ceratitis capitata]CAD7005105.1 unnamed protein product [Ceratitis capitata]
MEWSLIWIASIVIKALKLILNLAILIIYRIGAGGYFLGVGGTWNLWEEKSAGCEIFASGVFFGFIVYTGVHTIAYFFGPNKYRHELTDTMMNVVGTFLWVLVGGIALHYWVGYMDTSDYSYLGIQHVPVNASSEKLVGIIMGSLCILEGALYLVDTVMSCLHYSKGDTEYTGVAR